MPGSMGIGIKYPCTQIHVNSENTRAISDRPGVAVVEMGAVLDNRIVGAVEGSTAVGVAAGASGLFAQQAQGDESLIGGLGGWTRVWL